MGIDVYIFHNDAKEVLSPTYAHRNDVEVLCCPIGLFQLQTFTYAIIVLRNHCKWNLMMDSEENAMLGMGDGDAFMRQEISLLKPYITMKQSHIENSIEWVVMKNPGYLLPTYQSPSDY